MSASRWWPRMPHSRAARIAVLTLYYLAIAAGVVLVRLLPDYTAIGFVYQAF